MVRAWRLRFLPFADALLFSCSFWIDVFSGGMLSLVVFQGFLCLFRSRRGLVCLSFRPFEGIFDLVDIFFFLHV